MCWDEVKDVDTAKFKGASKTGNEHDMFGSVDGAISILYNGRVVCPFLKEFPGRYISKEPYGKGKIFNGYTYFWKEEVGAHTRKEEFDEECFEIRAEDNNGLCDGKPG